MYLTLSANEEVLRQARRHAKALGTSVSQLLRDYLQQIAGTTDPSIDAAEFERLSELANGNSRGWTFNREELHERR